MWEESAQLLLVAIQVVATCRRKDAAEEVVLAFAARRRLHRLQNKAVARLQEAKVSRHLVLQWRTAGRQTQLRLRLLACDGVYEIDTHTKKTVQTLYIFLEQ